MGRQLVNMLGHNQQNDAMKDTWGHFYPEPKSKWYGEIIIAIGEYGNETIVKSDFPGLGSSPQRYHMEHTLLERVDLEPGIYRVSCGLWFFKDCHDMYLNKPIGRLLNVKIKKIEI